MNLYAMGFENVPYKYGWDTVAKLIFRVISLRIISHTRQFKDVFAYDIHKIRVILVCRLTFTNDDAIINVIPSITVSNLTALSVK